MHFRRGSEIDPCLPTEGCIKRHASFRQRIINGGSRGEHAQATADAAEEREAAALAERVRTGDTAAEEELVNRYSRPAILELLGITGDSELASDLQQETFRVVLERLRGRGLEIPSKLGAYVRRTARNLALAERRRLARFAASSAAQEAEHISDPTEDALSAMVRNEEALCLRRALAGLRKGRDRELLSRFYLAEEDRESIRRDLGVTTLHFNRLLFRARRRLGDALAGERKARR
jgi:RNA polymerase sigma-70 factor (ECF subfamily)